MQRASSLRLNVDEDEKDMMKYLGSLREITTRRKSIYQQNSPGLNTRLHRSVTNNRFNPPGRHIRAGTRRLRRLSLNNVRLIRLINMKIGNVPCIQSLNNLIKANIHISLNIFLNLLTKCRTSHKYNKLCKTTGQKLEQSKNQSI